MGNDPRNTSWSALIPGHHKPNGSSKLNNYECGSRPILGLPKDSKADRYKAHDTIGFSVFRGKRERKKNTTNYAHIWMWLLFAALSKG